MEKENLELLEKVARDRLEKSLSSNSEESDTAFREAMVAVDKIDQIKKTSVSEEDLIEKRKLEVERQIQESKSKKKDRWLKGIEIVAVVIAVPIIDYLAKEKFAHDICEFEKNYSFTTTPGRSLSGIFKWKK